MYVVQERGMPRLPLFVAFAESPIKGCESINHTKYAVVLHVREIASASFSTWGEREKSQDPSLHRCNGLASKICTSGGPPDRTLCCDVAVDMLAVFKQALFMAQRPSRHLMMSG